jgi:cold shock CspA family protein
LFNKEEKLSRRRKGTTSPQVKGAPKGTFEGIIRTFNRKNRFGFVQAAGLRRDVLLLRETAKKCGLSLGLLVPGRLVKVEVERVPEGLRARRIELLEARTT